MMTTAQALLWSGILTFVMLMVASACRARIWAPGGVAAAFGNRDNLPPPTELAGRAHRAAKNQMEAMVMFVAFVLAASVTGKTGHAAFGATVFFWARLLYWPVYLAGIVYLRTAVWFVSIFGLIAILIEIW